MDSDHSIGDKEHPAHDALQMDNECPAQCSSINLLSFDFTNFNVDKVDAIVTETRVAVAARGYGEDVDDGVDDATCFSAPVAQCPSALAGACASASEDQCPSALAGDRASASVDQCLSAYAGASALVSMMGPDRSVAVPNRVACIQVEQVGDLAEIAEFVAILSAPITRQDQFYVATIDQHVNGEANPMWLTYRIGRCTGSAVGSIHGVNKHCTKKKQLQEMLAPSFKGNCMTQYGNDHEDDAQACFATWQSVRLLDEEEDAEGFSLEHVELENFGLCICRAFPPFAMSPDGFLVETWVKRVHQDAGTPHHLPTPGLQAPVPEMQVPAPDIRTDASDTPVQETAQAQAQAQEGQVEVQAQARVQAQVQVQEPIVGPRPNGVVYERRADGAVYAVKTKRILVEYKCPWGKRAKSWYDDVDVYPLEHIVKADGLVLPVPSYYFAQCSYGMHVLGTLDDLLSPPEYAYFVVWHPAKYTEPFPDFWVAENAAKTSLTVAGEHGTIQITRIPYVDKYCRALEASARNFWTKEYAPGLWRKLKYGRPPVPEEPEELDFDKQSFLGPRQRTLEECLSGFSVIGDFGVALAPAKKAAEGKATVPGKVAVKAGQVKTVAKSAVKKPVPKATAAPTARTTVASAPNAVGARPIAPGSGKPRAVASASGPKAAAVQPSKRTR